MPEEQRVEFDGELILITAEGCPSCEEVKRQIEKEGLNPKIMDVTKDLRAAAVMERLKADSVPAVVFKGRLPEVNSGQEMYCLLDETLSPVRCVEAKEVEESLKQAGEG